MGFLKWLSKPSAKLLGQLGEEAIASKLFWTNLFGKKGFTLQNIYIPTGNDKTVEIDVLYITAKGLFVIESKNYSGYIFGNEKNRNWISTLYVGKNFFGFKQTEKHHFYNPVWQNKTHINCLKRYLGRECPMYSVIVFSDRCEFKDVSYQSDDTYICYKSEFGNVISKIWNKAPDCLTEDEIKDIYSKLLQCTNADEATRIKHNIQIQNSSNNLQKCPLCGGDLVLRTARQGPYKGNQFYGCSNYPKCRYTRNI